MDMRGVAVRFQDDLYCHRGFANAQVTRDMTMPQAVQALSNEKRSALMQWITRLGPFWEEASQHNGDDDLLECKGEIVSDTGIGEAAYCRINGILRSLVSLKPSSWLTSPLSVDWHAYGRVQNTQVPNFWDPDTLAAFYASSAAQVKSWSELEAATRNDYPNLAFSDHSFEPLEGHPFSKSAAERLGSLFHVLNMMKSCFDERGRRTDEGHALYQDHFTGCNAWFSDSSATEKSRYKSKLTFPHPSNAGETLFCTWHGKVKTSQLRVHFSWPIQADRPLYIVYVGPKITKQ